MFTKSKLAKSVAIATAFGTLSSLSLTNIALAQEDAVEEEEVEKIAITGSRIKRADLEGALPVTVIDRQQIDFSGQTSVADLLRNTAFNSTGSFRPQSGSSAQGVSQINLRGLGASRTLVLVDGRRLAVSPSTGNSQDLNSIPAAAVERIEILSDGASAVYGSDAIGGVINIITRKDFNGVELRLGAAQIEHEGGDREEGSVIFGTSSDKGQMLGGVSWRSRDIIFARDLPWYSPGGSFFSQNWRVADSADRNQAWNLNQTRTFNPDGTRIDNNRDGALNELDNFYQSWSEIQGACDQGEFYTIAYSPAVVGPDGQRTRCGFNFASVSADEASSGNLGFFLNSRYEINDDWSVFSNMSITKSSSFGRYAPSLAEVRVGADSPNNPLNPNSPYYQDVGQPNSVPVTILHRFAGLGNRDNDVENTLQDLHLGFEGDIDGVLVDFSVRRNKSRTYDIGRNYVVIPIAEQFLNEGTYLVGDLDRNPADVLNSMKATISRIGDYNQDEVAGSVQFDLFDMDGGTAVMIVGGEWRDIEYSDQYDSLSEGGVIGGSSGNSAGGTRQTSAAYIEAVFPYTDELEITAALRRDRYSDYGSDVSPKVSVRYNPTDELLLRASYGEGFRAPSLVILTQQPSFSADSVRDPQHCAAVGLAPDCSDQVNVTVIANPELESETSKQYSAGIAYEPFEWLDFSLDYFNIEIDNRIRAFSSGALISLDNAGRALPAGMSITRELGGEIVSIVRGFGNQGTLETDGLDLNLNTNFDLNEFGRLRQNLTISYTNSFDIDGVDQLQFEARPEYRGVFTNILSVGDFDLVWNMNIIGDTVFTNGDPVPHWITNDAQVTYNAPWNGKITVGVRNISGKEPILGTDPDGSRDYNFDLYDGYGRTVYARYTQSF